MFVVFFFKQMTAYERRMSDWSSDVCSSDLVRRWLSRANGDPQWGSDERSADVRALVVVHRMAATRLGFPNLYSALNDQAPLSLKDGLEDGSAWPLRPFLTYFLPLALAIRADNGFQIGRAHVGTQVTNATLV